VLEILVRQSDERVLEIGPGTGYYTLAVAAALDGGTLDIFDISHAFLDGVIRTARDQGIDNIVATQGDARSLPYGDDGFDAAFLVAVLGEIPDQHVALGELARVLRPGGRLAVSGGCGPARRNRHRHAGWLMQDRTADGAGTIVPQAS
jgi:ubiquinone/menaquinone biosynthesis C-methylase UbiE